MSWYRAIELGLALVGAGYLGNLTACLLDEWLGGRVRAMIFLALAVAIACQAVSGMQ